MKYPKYLTFALIVFAASIAYAMYAQEIPEGAQGPNAEEIKQFEQEFGAPPEAFKEPEVSRPEFEQPGKAPEEVKQYVSDKELVEVYCAMTKWKSGAFFTALDAVKKHVVPAVEKVRELGIEVSVPDVDALKAEGLKRITAICGANTIDETQQLSEEFSSWGQNQAKAGFDSLRTDLQSKIKAKGDKLRQEVKTEIDSLVAEEKQKIESELRDEAQKMGEAKEVELKESQVEPDIEAIKSEMKGQMELKAAAKKSELEKKIRARVDELTGGQKQKFKAIGKLFEGIDKKINGEIKAGEGQYDQYKNQAFDLRKNLVFKILDKNIEGGLKQLDAASADIDEARKEDPSIKNVGEVKADIAQDRQVLASKLDAALESGDENAFQASLNDFRVKWENYRRDMEKAASQAIGKACTIALAQFGQARTKIDSEAGKIKDLKARCAGSVTDECLKVNEFAPRLGILESKFADIKIEMGLAEKMCQTPETADRKNLIALMKKIQSDGEDVKVYGKALEAEKSKVIAESADQACAQILPQLRAAKTEINKNDLAALKSNVAKCVGKNTEQCVVINSLKPQVVEFETQVASFVKNADAVEKICQGNKTEKDLFDLQAAGNVLKIQGEAIKAAGKKLEAEQAEKGSEKAFCRAAVPGLNIAKTKISSGFREMNAIRSECQDKTDNRCQSVNSLSLRFDEIKSKGDLALKQAGIIEAACKNAGTEIPDPALIQQLEDLGKMQSEIEKMVADLKSSTDAMRATKGSVWIEAESAASFNKRLGVSNPMAREVNPSWRPPYFGDGSWYMGAGGDYLIYKFNATVNGSYNVWVRDLASNIPSQLGQAVITIYFDGKSIGSFAENTQGRTTSYPKGAFYWHMVGVVALSAGEHTMKIEKQSTTSRAAILDAFYLTTGNDAPPEK